MKTTTANGAWDLEEPGHCEANQEGAHWHGHSQAHVSLRAAQAKLLP